MPVTATDPREFFGFVSASVLGTTFLPHPGLERAAIQMIAKVKLRTERLERRG